MKTIQYFVNKHNFLIIFGIIFSLHVFLRFYQLEARGQFTWDQVDFAWTAKDMIVNGKFPLQGVMVKQNTGFHIGPAYHYLIYPFYYVYDLDPRAALVFAGVTSIFSLLVCFYCTLQLFNKKIALIAAFIYALSFYVIEFDRVQWSVNFVAPVSYIIFYSFYKVLIGKVKYIYLLATALGFSFHLHFTSVFFPIIIFLSVPFFKFSKTTTKPILLSIGLLFIWFIPTIISEVIEKVSSTGNMIRYINSSNHGFHLTRFFQIANEAFIEFETIFTFKFIKEIKYIFLPLFYFLYFRSGIDREKIVFSYLLLLWFLIPWIAFSLYTGEITVYYFSVTRMLAIMVFAYLVGKLLENRMVYFKMFAVGLLILYSYVNLKSFFEARYQGLSYHREKVQNSIRKGEVIEFSQGVPESYLYYLYAEYKKNKK